MGLGTKLLWGVSLSLFLAAGVNLYVNSPEHSGTASLSLRVEDQNIQKVSQVDKSSPKAVPPYSFLETNDNLLDDRRNLASEKAPEDVEVKHVKLNAVIDKNPKHLEATSHLNLTLDGKKFTVSRESFTKKRGSNAITWVGAINNDKNTVAIISVVNGIMAASFQTPDGFYTIEYNDRTNHYQQTKINKIEMGDDMLTFAEGEEFAAGATANSDDIEYAANDTGLAVASNADVHIIDILVAYSRETFSTASGESALIAKIHNGIELANQTFQRSKVDAKLNLVHTMRTNYTGSGNLETDLKRLAIKDGYADDVWHARNDYGADLYSLVVANRTTNYIGFAYFPVGPVKGASVIHTNYITTPAFPHEIGHNFGLGHQVGGGGSTPLFPYGRPYQFGTQKWTTVMWTPMQGDKHLFNYSNPTVSHDGRPTGIVNKYDEARAANLRAKTLSNFKKSVVPVQEPIISSVSNNVNAMVGENIQLNVVATGENLSYQWKKNNANLSDNATISGSKSATLSIHNSTQSDSGDYQVLVTNQYGSALSAKIVVSVNSLQGPTANAGADFSVSLGSTATLNGTASTDPQGYNLSYSWTKLSGPSVSLMNANTATPSFHANTAGDYVFRLTVSNGSHSAQDTVTVSVEEAATTTALLKTRHVRTSKSSTTYELKVEMDSALKKEVKRVYYSFYVNGILNHTQTSVTKGTNFRINKLIRNAFEVRARVEFKDGSTINTQAGEIIPLH